MRKLFISLLVEIFEYKKGNLYFNQDLSNHSLLIEIGNDKSSDDDIEKCTNALVSALKAIYIKN
ncbi:stage II sporulation protein P [Clostridium sp. MB40-C1]|uniref:stage II sporulation protein P n=1 Tax=Clostridium sp. MB40-C1 TaxID=3070996 RepID=UPI0027DFD024|nr:stage II sporulation protein P [Clostridium sp. MB40-C1]WMJ79133.1 stage II sporulation protein P [Clostridium sp. MB40-C1]